MSRIDMQRKLAKNLSDRTIAQSDIGKLKSAIFYNKITDLREEKRKYIDRIIENHLEVYGQKDDSFKDQITSIKEEYMFQLGRIEAVYGRTFSDIYKVIDSVISNQNAAIDNFICLDEKLFDKTLTEYEIKKIKYTQKAETRRIQNYDAVLKECFARLDWCLSDSIKSINEIFVELDDGLKKKESEEESYDDFFSKFITKIKNMLGGKFKFINYLNRLEDTWLLKIKKNADDKVFEVSGTLAGISKQMRKAKDKIKAIYDNQINAFQG